jgi:hypothetical protein
VWDHDDRVAFQAIADQITEASRGGLVELEDG